MIKYSYPALIIHFLKANHLSQSRLEDIAKRRLEDIVRYAKSRSPFFRALYKNLPEKFTLEDLPPVDKKTMMSNFDDYVTDRKVKLADVQAFIADKGNIGKDFHRRYLVATTSGSTGVPSIVLHDGNSTRSAAILTMARYMKCRFPLAAFCVDDVFLIENGNIRNNIRKMPLLSNSIWLVNAKDIYEEICRNVNRIRPKVMVGYAGSMELLADQALLGNLHIDPVQVITSGEFLTPATRDKIRKAFPKAEVISVYGCTEGNVVAYECPHHHMHLNSDFYILEPVDNCNNPVPDGVVSDKVLLTNLANFVQPIIRFSMTDRITMHHEPCPCGRQGAWFTVEGRSNDVLTMTDRDGNPVRLAPLPFIFVIEPIEGINNFQMVLHGSSDIELRIDFLPGSDHEKVFAEAEREIRRYLGKFGVEEFTVTLSDLPPQRSARTGKFRQMYQED